MKKLFFALAIIFTGTFTLLHAQVTGDGDEPEGRETTWHVGPGWEYKCPEGGSGCIEA